MKTLELTSHGDSYLAVLDRNNIRALLDYSHPNHVYHFSAYFELNAKVAIKLHTLGISKLFLDSKLSEYLP